LVVRLFVLEKIKGARPLNEYFKFSVEDNTKKNVENTRYNGVK